MILFQVALLLNTLLHFRMQEARNLKQFILCTLHVSHLI
jgi:hypothetical protein